MSKIERASGFGRFTPAEMMEKVAESKRFWSSPEGIRKQAELDREAELRAMNPRPPKFPELARSGTRPALVTATTPAAPVRDAQAKALDLLR